MDTSEIAKNFRKSLDAFIELKIREEFNKHIKEYHSYNKNVLPKIKTLGDECVFINGVKAKAKYINMNGILYEIDNY